MKKRPFMYLGPFTAVAVAVAVVLGVFEDGGMNKQVHEDRLAFPDLKASLPTLTRVRLGETLLNYADNRWVMGSHDDLPVQTVKVNKLLIGLSDVKLLEAKTDNPSLYDRLNLGEKAKHLTLGNAEKDVLSFFIGKAAPGGAGKYYIRMEDAPQSWVAGPMPDTNISISDWADLDIPNLSKPRVAHVTITHPDGDTIKAGRKVPEDPIRLQALSGAEHPKYEGVGDALAGAFNFLTFEDVKRAEKVDFTNALTTQYHCFDGLILTAYLSQQNDNWWMKVTAQRQAPMDVDRIPDAPEDADAELARFQSLSPWALQIPNYKVAEMVKRRADFLTNDKNTEDNSHE